MTNSHIQQLSNDIFCANVLLGEVSSATYVDSNILLENDDFRNLLTSYAVRSDVPFNEAVSALTKFANANF